MAIYKILIVLLNEALKKTIKIYRALAASCTDIHACLFSLPDGDYPQGINICAPPQRSTLVPLVTFFSFFKRQKLISELYAK